MKKSEKYTLIAIVGICTLGAYFIHKPVSAVKTSIHAITISDSGMDTVSWVVDHSEIINQDSVIKPHTRK